MSEHNEIEQSVRHEQVVTYAKTMARFAGSLAGAALVVSPVATVEGLSNASIEATVVQAPSTVTFTGDGNSSLRLGIPGSLFTHKNFMDVGVTAQVHGPGDIDDYFTNDSVKLYAGLAKNPEAAVDGYQKFLIEDATDKGVDYLIPNALTLGVGTWLGVELLRSRRKNKNKDPFTRKQVAGYSLAAFSVALAASSCMAHSQFQDFAEASPKPQGEEKFLITKLNNTEFAGTYADTSILASATNDAVNKGREYYERGRSKAEAYVTSVTTQLEEKRNQIAAPREDEVAIMTQSDIHDNETMMKIQGEVVRTNNELYGDGTVSAVISAGDFGYGTLAEAPYYNQNIGIADGAPFWAVKGNHDLKPAIALLEDSGVQFADGEVVDAGGTSLLGMADPRNTKFLGATTPVDGIAKEYELGQKAREIAEDEHPELTFVHECYAAASMVGVEDSQDFIEGGIGQDYQTPVEDGIDDVPTNFVGCGHWHRDVPFRVIWNSDGSWTTYMEFNTSGGAIADPTFGFFSIPYEPPRQLASFYMLFKNKTSGLITGAQKYEFRPDGTMLIKPRIDIGSPDGQPFTVSPFLGPEAGKNPGTTNTSEQPQPSFHQ